MRKVKSAMRGHASNNAVQNLGKEVLALLDGASAAAAAKQSRVASGTPGRGSASPSIYGHYERCGKLLQERQERLEERFEAITSTSGHPPELEC